MPTLEKPRPSGRGDVTVISLEDIRAARNAPEPSCVSTDSEGNPVSLYSLSYRHNDRTYVFDIWARSREDAEERLESIRKTLKLVGQVVAEA